MSLWYKLQSFWYDLKRAWYYGWNLRKSYDWDGSTIYDVIYFKLNALHYNMLHNSHLLWNSTPDSNLMRKLCEAKHLAKKLMEADNGYDINYRNVKRKYRSEADDIFRSWYAEIFPETKPIDPTLESFFTRKAFQKDNQEKKSDAERLFYLLNKYSSHWWD